MESSCDFAVCIVGALGRGAGRVLHLGGPVVPAVQWSHFPSTDSRMRSPAPKTMILKRRPRWRSPPSVRAYLRQRDHPRARTRRCCKGASVALRPRPLERPTAPLIPKKSSSSQNRGSNSLRQAIWSRRGSYSKELRKPGTPSQRWRWAKLVSEGRELWLTGGIAAA